MIEITQRPISLQREGFPDCQHVIDQFKESLPTKKVETYQDGSVDGEE